jgi:hypothetical protein
MPMGGPDEAVLVEQRGRILIATINRPQARNAVNQDAAEGRRAFAEKRPPAWLGR